MCEPNRVYRLAEEGAAVLKDGEEESVVLRIAVLKDGEEESVMLWIAVAVPRS